MKNVMLIMVCLSVCAGIASSATVTINAAQIEGWPYLGYGAEATNIGAYTIPGSVFTQQDSHLAAFSASEYGANVEWRVQVAYDVRPAILGFDPSQVVSAKLKFDTTGQVNGWRDMVAVDQILSWLGGITDGWELMYGYRIAPAIVANEAATGSHSVDITEALKVAMNNSITETRFLSGMSFVWYADNDADVDLGNGLVSPYDGSGTVVYTTGYRVDNAVIEVTLIPEPVTVALLSLGGLFLRRRK